ncbi:uncharacterized protein RJT21DRAFT_116892 [Scheffersomyces amazonensis]|uniref:uncharacterized protein n=1 Tax=Scheffersomyces amazonensis TaxID=1078765 RepID=UPI00315D5C74
MSEIKQYLKHPILVNPTSWIKSRPIEHASKLYFKDFYKPELLENNPYAKGLVDTKADGMTNRYPIGSLIRLTASMTAGQDNTYQVFPIFKNAITSDKYYFTSHYMTNDEFYIKTIVVDQGYRNAPKFLPRKISSRHQGSFNSEFVPNFIELLEKNYEDGIDEMLNNIEDTNTTNFGIDEPKMILRKEGPLVNIEDVSTIINITKLCDKFTSTSDEIVLSYVSHSELCELILRYLTFKFESRETKSSL